MSRRRRVLSIAVEPDLCARLRGLLCVYGVELRESESGPEGGDIVDEIDALAPALVIVGVEAGRRDGFGVIARLRRARGGTLRILLVSGTLSSREFDLHVKQRYHADAVLDTSSADDAAIEELLRDLKAIPRRARRQRSAAPADAASTSGGVSGSSVEPPRETESGSPTPSRVGSGRRSRDEWVEPLLERIARRRAGAADPGDPPRSGEAPDAAAELEVREEVEADTPTLLAQRDVEIARLREELERSRRYLRSSPFSGDFERLRDEAEERETRVQELEDALEELTQERSDHEDRLYELGELLLEARERIGHAETGLHEAEARLARRQALMESARKAVVAQYEDRLSRERALHEQALQRAETEVRKIEESYANVIERLEEVRKRELADLHQQLTADRDARLARREREWQRRLHDQEEIHEAQLEDLRNEQASVDQAQQAAQELALGELERRLEEERAAAASAMREVLASHETALHEAAQQREVEIEALSGRLEGERAKLEHALVQERALREAVEQASREELQALEAKSAARLRESEEERLREIEGLEQRLQLEGREALHSLASAAQQKLDSARAEHRQVVDELRESHAEALAALRAEHERAVQSAQQDHLAELDTLKQLRAADLHAAEEANTTLLERLQQKHGQALGAQTEKHRQELELLRSRLAREQAARHDLRQQLEATREQAKAQLAEVRARAVQDRAVALEELSRKAKAESLRALSASQAAADRRLEEVSRQHGEALAALREAHADELARLRASHQETLGNLEEKQQLELQKLNEAHQAELRLAETARERDQSRAAVEHDQAIAAIGRRFETKLSRMQRDLEAERAAHAETRTRAGEQVKQLEASHRQSIDRLQGSQRDSAHADAARFQQQLAEIESENQRSLEALRLELSNRHAEALASAGEAFERERQAMIADHESELERLEKDHAAALASMDEMRRAEFHRMEQLLNDEREEHAQETARALLRNGG